MSNLKIARQAYRRARQSSLNTFADNVFKRMNGVAAYQDLQPQVQVLATRLDAYQQCLSAARNRGHAEVVAKNLAQTALLQQLNELATRLEYLAGDSPQLIVDAGFTIQQTPVRYTGKLPAPVILRASSTGRKGEVRVTVDDQAPRKSVTTHAVEYSLNRENGWQNGTYHSHRNFLVAGLPRAEELWMRLKSLGHGDNRSDWSEPVVVSVL